MRSLLIFPLALAVAVGASSARTDTARDVAVRWFAAAEAGDHAAMLALLAEQAIYEDVTFDYRVQGRESIGLMLRDALASLAPVERRLIRIVADSASAVVEWEAAGTHAAPILGVAATGRRLTIRAVSLLEVRDGRIVRVTDYTDRAGLERQLQAAAPARSP